MEEEIQSMTSSEWKLVHRRLDDLENLVTDLKLKLEILGECKCNRSNSDVETQHSDNEVTETIIGLNKQLNAPSAIIDDVGHSTTQSEETVTLTLEAWDANNTADSTPIASTSSKSSDCTSLSIADNRRAVSNKSTSPLSNGIGIYDLEKYRRAQVKLKRCDQVEAMGTSSSSSEFREQENNC